MKFNSQQPGPDFPCVLYWTSGTGHKNPTSSPVQKADSLWFASRDEADKFRTKMVKLMESRTTYRTRHILHVGQVESI